ncbi:hypothetical protein AUJ95_09390 [Candidatus Desantisbacteria bacterium CG2_30_40_21]|nr:MAG: hypothetical protein AUJ95_09390 [Candidatus Desantisbacteria bacterium CG2_30_40_21]
MDKNTVKKIMTFKSGVFVFSSKFFSEDITQLLVETKILHATIKDIPILPESFASIEEDVIRKSIFGTAAIEGNPLKETDVQRVLSEKQKAEKLKDAEQQIKNLKDAYDGIHHFVDTYRQQAAEMLKRKEVSPFVITEDLIKWIHGLITNGILPSTNIPGQYRNHPVKVGDKEHGGIDTPPKIFEDINQLMKEFCLWINSEEIIGLGPEIRAALAHYHLGLIHPFGDGNGRTARLIEAIILLSSGVKYAPLMLSNFYYRNIDEYFMVFSQSRKNKEHVVTPFIRFMLRGMVESLREIKDRIIAFVRVLVLKNYYQRLKDTKKISQRQYDLINSISMPFVTEELFDGKSPLCIVYRNISKRTALRDLEKLIQMNILTVTEDKKYMLNALMLG